jgi:hypothetical protein
MGDGGDTEVKDTLVTRCVLDGRRG